MRRPAQAHSQHREWKHSRSLLVLLQVGALVASLAAPLPAAIAADPTAAPAPIANVPVIPDAASPAPSDSPSPAPSDSPSPAPSDSPTPAPSDSPTPAPSDSAAPSDSPMPAPSASPSPSPTDSPIAAPSDSPSPSPSDSPSPSPSDSPSSSPTDSPSPAPTDTPVSTPAPDLTPVSLIVRFASGVSTADQDAILASAGATGVGSIAQLGIRIVSVPTAYAYNAKLSLAAEPRVLTIDNDRVRAADSAPSDPGYSSQWNLPQIGWDTAWQSVTPTGTSTIAVLDTGIDASHPDLAGHVVDGWSAFGGNPMSDPNGHGTAVAGIAAATSFNGVGIAGVAYAGVDILSVQVLDASGAGTDSDIIAGVLWAADHGAGVILMAFSNPGYSSALQAAIDYAWSKGVVIVAATGNAGSTGATYPAGDAHVMGVSATDQADALAAGSNSGADTFIAAPGVDIPALLPGGGTTTVSGTSAAAAEVAGAAAILRAIDESATNGQVVGRLGATAAKAGSKSDTGNGRLDLGLAVTSMSQAYIDPLGVPDGGGPFVGPYTIAVTKYWAGCADTTWSNTNNWSTSSTPTCTGGVPSSITTAAGSADTATILGSRTFYPNLTTGTTTIAGLTVSAGGSVTVAGGTLTVTAGSFAVSGTLTVSSGTVNITPAWSVAAGGTLSQSGGTILAAGSLTVNGTVTQSGGLIHENASATTNPTAGSVSLSTSGASITQSGTGQIDTYNFTTVSSTTYTQQAGLLKIWHNVTNPGVFNSTGGTIEFAGSNSGTTGFNATGTNQFTNVQVDAGITFGFRGSTNIQILVAGNWTTNSAPTMTNATANPTITFNGTGTQTIGGTVSTVFRNLTINKASGSVVLARNATVGTTTAASGTLTFASGNAANIVTGTVAAGVYPFTMIIASGGTVSRTAGFVEGNLQKAITTGTNVARTFEVGTGTTYAPVTVTYASVTVAGTLAVASVAGQHPNIATSSIVTTLDVSRSWTLTSATTTFTTASAAFTYANPGDITGGTPTGYITQRYSGGTWTTPASSTPACGATCTTTATLLAAFGSFAIGTQVTTASDASGALSVSPTSTTAGSSGNVLTFTFTAPAAADFSASSALTIDVPATWTAPQTSSASTAGYVTVTAGTCTPGSPSVTGAGPWTITISQACLHGTSFTVTYGADTSTRITAPQAVVTSTFTAKTRNGAGGTLTALNAAPYSPTVAVVAGAATKLQVLLPGEVASAGSATGKTAALPNAATAGSAVSVTVNAVDAYWNIVSTVTSTVAITSTDANATLPSPNPSLTAGTGTFLVTPKTAGTATITAAWVSGGSALSAGTSATLTINPAAASQLQVLLPGETVAPGTGTGQTGTPTPVTSGSTIVATVRVVDAYFNLVTTATPVVTITSSDTNATVPSPGYTFTTGGGNDNGQHAFNVTLMTAGTWYVRAAFVSGSPTLASRNSSNVSVSAGTATKLQALLPGETATAGSATGKTGTATAITAGAAVTVTVNAVDANWNIVTTANPTVAITTNDTYAVLPGSAALAIGTGQFSVTFKTAGSRTVTAAYSAGTPILASGSDTVTVNPDSAGQLKLQVILPGETAVPGSPTGKSGTPSAQTAGTGFSATVKVVDANWNVVTTATPQVTITTTDPADTEPGPYTYLSGDLGSHAFTLTLKTAGSWTAQATATSITTGTSASVTVGASTAWQLAVTSVNGGTSPTAGSGFSVVVAIRDQYGNATTTASTRNVTLTVATGLGTIGGTTTGTVAIGAGTTTINGVVYSNGPESGVSLTVSDQASVLLPGTSATFSTLAASSVNIAVSLGTGSIVAAPGTSSTTATVTVTGPAPTFTPLPSRSVTFSRGSGDIGFDVSAGSCGSPTAAITGTTNGSGQLTVKVCASKTADTETVTATDTLASAFTSVTLTETAGPATRLQVLLPWETAVPGSVSGKTGTQSSSFFAGSALSATVRAVDQYWNLVSTVNPTVAITSSDAFAGLPSNAAISGGTGTFLVTLKTAGSATVTATDASVSPTLAAGTSSAETVSAGTATKLQTLLPGETAVPGSTTGKTGAPNAVTSPATVSVTVNAVDAYWNRTTATPTVHITSSDGIATLPSNAALVSGTGTISVTLRTAGSQSVTATDTAGSTPLTAGPSANVTVSAGAATQFTVVPASFTTTAGTALNVVVTALDQFGNLATAYGGTVRVTSSDGAALLPANARLVDGGGNPVGFRTFSVTLKTAGAQTVTATDTVASSLTKTSGSITVSPATAAGIALVLVPASIVANASDTSTATATVTDAYGNAVTGETVTITRVGDTTIGAVTDAGLGRYVATITSSKTADSETITATDAAHGLSTFTTLIETAGPATKLQVLLPGETAAPGTTDGKTGTPAAQTAGTAFNVTVRAVDQYWNLTSATPAVAVTSTDANAALPATASLAGGTGTFALTFHTAGTWTVTGTDTAAIGGLTANTSATVLVAAGAATKLQILMPGEFAAPGTVTGKTGTPDAKVAGTAFTATVNAVDANWNLVTTAISTVHLTSSDGAAVLAADAALVGGTTSPSVTLKTVGLRTVTAAEPGGSPTLSSSTSASVAVTPADATHFTVVPTAYTVTAGTAVDVVITAIDAYGNVDTTYTNTVGFTSTDSAATVFDSSTSAYVLVTSGFTWTFVAGDGTDTFSFILRTACPSPPTPCRTITVTDTIDALVTGTTSPSILVNAAAAQNVSLTLSPNHITADFASTTTATATVTDASGNGLSGKAIHFSSGGDVTFSASGNCTTASNGTCSVTITASKTADTETITATDTTDSKSTSATLIEDPGSVSKLLVLLPWETAAPGTATGRSGTQGSTFTAGSVLDATVRAVDQYWNLVSTATPTVAITSSDANAVLPANGVLVGGVGTFNVTLKKAGSSSVTATDTLAALAPNTSSAETVTAGTATQLQVLLGGETAAAGTVSGKSGTPAAITAGGSASVTVNATDAWWNISSGAAPTVSISSTDTHASAVSNVVLASGTGSTSITLKTAGAWTVSATYVSGLPTGLATAGPGGTAAVGTSSLVTVNAGIAARLQVLLAGQTADPGSATGKTGTPTAVTAGGSTTATIRAVDANWNLVSSAGPTVTVSATDANAPAVSNQTLVGGTRAVSVTLTTATLLGWTVTATYLSGIPSGLSPDTSTAVLVNAGTAIGLQVLLPGETGAPGTATGKTGTPAAITAGAAFSGVPGGVVVNAVDAFWNITTGTNPTVAISSSDADAGLPSSHALSSGTWTFTGVTLKTAGTQTVTATGTSPSLSGTSANVQVNAGAAVKLQVLLPGEVADPGSSSGRGGAPTGITTGATVSVTVNAVDTYWNVVSTASPAITITSSDATATVPASPADLVLGTRNYPVTFTKAGSWTVSAAAPGFSTASSSSIAVSVGPVAKLQVLVLSQSINGAGRTGETAAPGTATGKTGAPFDVKVGVTSPGPETLTVTVNAVDAWWNVVSSAAPTVSFATTDASGVLSALSGTLASGTGTFTVTFHTADYQTVTATDQASHLTPSTSAQIHANPGDATHFTVTAPSSAVAGTAFGFTVTARDLYENVATGYAGSVYFSSTDAGGSTVLPSPGTLVAGTGTGSFTATLATAPATSTITAANAASSPTITGTTGSIVVAAASAASITLSLSYTTIIADPDADFPAPCPACTWSHTSVADAYVTDSLGNPVTTATVAFTTTGDVTFGSVTNLGTGHYIATITASRTADVETIRATVGSFSNTAILTEVPLPASKILVLLPGETAIPGSEELGTGKTGVPTTQTAGVPFSVHVYAVDEYWNVVATAGYGVQAYASTDPHAVLPAPGIFLSGAQTFSVTLRTAGSWTIAVREPGGSPTLAPGTSSSVAVGIGAAVGFQVLLPGEIADPGSTTGKSGTPADVTAGTPVSVVVNAVDAAFNRVTTGAASTATVTVTTTDTGAATTVPSAAALSAGTHSFNSPANGVTLTTTGFWTVSATSTSPVLAGTSAQVQVNAATAAKLVVTSVNGGSNPKAGTGFTAVVGVQDAYGNAAKVTASTAILLARYSGTGAFGGTLTGTIGTGTGSVSINGVTYTVAESGVAVEATRTSGMSLTAGHSASFTVDAAAAVNVSLVLSSTVIVADPDATSTTATVTVTSTGGSPIGNHEVWFTTGGDVTFSGSGRCTTDAGTGQCEVIITSSTTADTEHITATDHDPSASSASASADLTEIAGAPVHLLVLADGQTWTPGDISSPHKGATPSITAGTAFTAHVYAVDEYYNWNSTVGSSVSVTSHFNGSPPGYAVMPAAHGLTSGHEPFAVTMRTAGSWDLTASDPAYVPAGAPPPPAQIGLSPDTLSIIVAPGAATRLQVLVVGNAADPFATGETADPGSATGKTGSPAADIPAGADVEIVVNVVDAWWNVVDSPSARPTVTFTADYGVLPNPIADCVTPSTYCVPGDYAFVAGDHGTKHFTDVAGETFTFYRSGYPTVTVADTAGTSPLTSATSSVIDIDPGAATHLAVSAPASVLGGTAFSLTVTALDQYGNVAVDYAGTVAFSSSPSTTPAAVLPSDGALVAGTGVGTFSATLMYEAGKSPQRITATDTVTGTITGWTDITVLAASATTLILTLDPTTIIADPDADFPSGCTTSCTWLHHSTASVESDVQGAVVSFLTDGDVTFSAPTCTTGSDFKCSVTITASRRAGVETIRASVGSVSATASLTEVPLPATKFLVLLPGETIVPGSLEAGSGKTGSPTAQIAGTPVPVRVYAVDEYWNVVSTATPTVALTATFGGTTAGYKSLPSNDALAAGFESFEVTFTTAGPWTMTATYVSGDPTGLATSGPGSTPATATTASVTVDPGPVAKLQVIVIGDADDPEPGEETADPGSSTGKAGGPEEDVLAGDLVRVQVNAVDAWWNVVTSATPTVSISTSSPHATYETANPAALVAGTRTFGLRFYAAGYPTVTATDTATSSPLASDTSSQVDVDPGTGVKLQVLAPGESGDPGGTTGRSGIPTTQVAGTPFTVTVNGVDQYWNVVDTLTTGATIGLTTSSPHSTPGTASGLVLTNGITQVTWTMYTAGSPTITATDTTYAVGPPQVGLLTGTSSGIPVSPTLASALQVLVPGETADPGGSTGKTGSPATQQAGSTFSVTVNAVDQYWNVVPAIAWNPTVNLSVSADANADMPADNALASGTQAFAVKLRTASDSGWPITVTDVTTPTPPVRLATAISGSVPVQSSTANALVFSVSPVATYHGDTLLPYPVVVIEDQFGNRVTTADRTVTVGIAGEGTPKTTGVPRLVATNNDKTRMTSAGIATFDDLNIHGAGTGYQLSVTGSGLAAGTSAAFDVTPRPISVTASTATMDFSGSTECVAPTAGSCSPSITLGTLATGDVGTFTEAFADANPGTGKAITPSGTIKDADGTTNVTASYAITWVPVTDGTISGTVIFAPAGIDIGSGFPGQSVTSDPVTIQWLTTEGSGSPLYITVTGVAPGLVNGATTISREDLWLVLSSLSGDTPVGTLDTVQHVKQLSPTTGSFPDSQEIHLRVHVPNAAPGVYSGSITFGVGS